MYQYVNILKQQPSRIVSIILLAFPSEFTTSLYSSELDLSGVQRIETVLRSKRGLLEQINGRDITVVLGNTGSGKSTMVNVLAGSTMKVDCDGYFTPEFGQERVRVRKDTSTATKFPELVLSTSVGDLCDLPGFQDSDGATDDLLNAAFMREVLTRARSVRALILTTQDELMSVRADPFRKLSGFMNFFQNREFRDHSCYLIANKVDRSLILHNRTESLFDNVYGIHEKKDLFLKDLVDSGRVFFIPAARSPSTLEEARNEKEMLLEAYARMAEIISPLPGRNIRVQELKVELNLSGDTVQTLAMFFHRLMEVKFGVFKENIFQKELEFYDHNKESSWHNFNAFLMEDSSLMTLYSFGNKAYEASLDAFKATFDREYDFCQKVALAEDLKRKALEAEEERKRAEDSYKESQEEMRRSQRKKEELEKLQAEEEIKAKKYADEVKKAKRKEQEHQTSIRKAKEDARIAEEERKKIQADIERNDQEKRAAVENARIKIAELERLKKQANEDELGKQQAINRAKEAERKRKLIEEEMVRHRENVQRMERQQQQKEEYMMEIQRLQEQVKRSAIQTEGQLNITRERLSSRDRELSQLRGQIESLRRDQGDVVSLRREIENLRKQLNDKNQEISTLRSSIY